MCTSVIRKDHFIVQAITALEKAREISFLSWKVIFSCLLCYRSAAEVLEWQRPQQPWPSHFFCTQKIIWGCHKEWFFHQQGAENVVCFNSLGRLRLFQDVAKYIPPKSGCTIKASPTMIFQFFQVWFGVLSTIASLCGSMQCVVTGASFHMRLGCISLWDWMKDFMAPKWPQKWPQSILLKRFLRGMPPRLP